MSKRNHVGPYFSMKVFSDIANSLDSDIQFTIETPSMSPDRKLACLDLKIWLDDEDQIMFQFNSKPMANPKVYERSGGQSQGHTREICSGSYN